MSHTKRLLLTCAVFMLLAMNSQAQELPCGLTEADLPMVETYEEFAAWAEENCPELLEGLPGPGDIPDFPEDMGDYPDPGDFPEGGDLPPCLLELETLEFETEEELIAYIEENCPELLEGGFIDGDMGDYPGDFPGEGDWDDYPEWDEDYPTGWDCGDFEWDETAEIEFLSEEFGDCIGEQTFDNIDELYNYIGENCLEDGFPVGDEDDVFIVLTDCIDGLAIEATFQEMLQYISENCAGEIDLEIPACFLDAPAFDNDEDFFAYIEENCADLLDFTDDSVDAPLNNDEMEQLAAAYNFNRNVSKDSDTASAVSNEELVMEDVIIGAFPNPAKDQVTVSLQDRNIASVELFDLSGSLLLNQRSNQATTSLDLSPLASGMYLVQVITDDGDRASRCIVKQ